MFKKIVTGILFFIIIFILSFVIHLPLESLVNYGIYRVEQISGVNIEYSTGKFGIFSSQLNDVEIFRGSKKLFAFDSVLVKVKPADVELLGNKESGRVRAVYQYQTKNISLNINNLNVVTEGTKLFKRISINEATFNYDPANHRGDGRIRLNLMESLDTLMVPSDILAEMDIKQSPETINVNITSFRGINVTGNGEVLITIDNKEFQDSPIQGSINVTGSQGRFTLKISGTLGNMDAVPKMDGGDFNRLP